LSLFVSRRGFPPIPLHAFQLEIDRIKAHLRLLRLQGRDGPKQGGAPSFNGLPSDVHLDFEFDVLGVETAVGRVRSLSALQAEPPVHAAAAFESLFQIFHSALLISCKTRINNSMSL